MCKNLKKCVKIEKSGRGRPGRGVVLEIRTHPDKGRGWFENPRFWRTSFVDGPLYSMKMRYINFLSRCFNSLLMKFEDFTPV